MNIKEEADIRLGVQRYFDGKNDANPSNQQRLARIKKALDSVGDPDSEVWVEIEGYVEDLGENFGLDKLPEILSDIQKEGVNSHYYKFSKSVVRQMQQEGYNAQSIREDWSKNQRLLKKV